MSDYRKLQVWRKAHALALNSHRAAARVRGYQNSSLRSQITRAAMSIPANIVEGREQRTDAAFARFLRIALASTSELDYHLIAARDIGVMTKSEHLSLTTQVVEVRMMLHGLLRRLEDPSASPPPRSTLPAAQ